MQHGSSLITGQNNSTNGFPKKYIKHRTAYLDGMGHPKSATLNYIRLYSAGTYIERPCDKNPGPKLIIIIGT